MIGQARIFLPATNGHDYSYQLMTDYGEDAAFMGDSAALGVAVTLLAHGKPVDQVFYQNAMIVNGTRLDSPSAFTLLGYGYGDNPVEQIGAQIAIPVRIEGNRGYIGNVVETKRDFQVDPNAFNPIEAYITTQGFNQGNLNIFSAFTQVTIGPSLLEYGTEISYFWTSLLKCIESPKITSSAPPPVLTPEPGPVLTPEPEPNEPITLPPPGSNPPPASGDNSNQIPSDAWYVDEFDGGASPMLGGWRMYAPTSTEQYLQSKAISDSAQTQVGLTVNMTQAGTLSVRFKTSSEDGYDKFQIFVDGLQVVALSGEMSEFAVFPYDLPAGSYDILFRYAKDSSVSVGDDCVYIDWVAITGAGSVTAYLNENESTPATTTPGGSESAPAAQTIVSETFSDDSWRNTFTIQAGESYFSLYEQQLRITPPMDGTRPVLRLAIPSTTSTYELAFDWTLTTMNDYIAIRSDQGQISYVWADEKGLGSGPTSVTFTGAQWVELEFSNGMNGTPLYIDNFTLAVQ